MFCGLHSTYARTRPCREARHGAEAETAQPGRETGGIAQITALGWIPTLQKDMAGDGADRITSRLGGGRHHRRDALQGLFSQAQRQPKLFGCLRRRET
jgi:hypothetical protein